MFDLFEPDVVKSFSSSEEEILVAIMRLHNDGRPFDVDPCYSIGGFYRSGVVPPPRLKFDAAPMTGGTQLASADNLPLADGSVASVVFDPPFMFNPHGSALTKNAASLRYTMFDTWDALERMYRGALAEFARVLASGGIVAFKCQDYTDTRTTMTHCLVYQWAIEAGFYAKDIFIRIRDHGPAYNPALKQKHARKHHSYWWIFVKL
jgi:hypothetical protein